jgi:hypothetical protein
LWKSAPDLLVCPHACGIGWRPTMLWARHNRRRWTEEVRTMSFPEELFFPVKISAGRFLIGSDTIPHAGPCHVVDLKEFWVDPVPVTMAHFEVFVARGGFADRRWWIDGPRGNFHTFTPRSVDQRCYEIQRISTDIVRQLGIVACSSRQVPAVGLTWFEASAICRLYGATLPFESEWEVAMAPRNCSVNREERSRPNLQSRWGCSVFSGCLEEWTASGFSPRHWRGNQLSDRSELDFTYGVCVRGSTRRALFTDVAARSSGDPVEGNALRGFRRRWSSAPKPDQLALTFNEASSAKPR